MRRLGWHSLGRIGGNAKVRLPSGGEYVTKASADEQARCTSARDPWLLATSLTDVSAADVVARHALRMKLGGTFRDAKGHLFGWSLRRARRLVRKADHPSAGGP